MSKFEEKLEAKECELIQLRATNSTLQGDISKLEREIGNL